MVDLLNYEFMRNALAAGILIGISCGVVGSFVVVNRAVFLAGGIAHAAYGGIGLAFLCGFSPFLGATLFALFSSTLLGVAIQRWDQRLDTVIGVLWATGMALGTILIDLSPGYHKDVMSYLFGSILAVSRPDLYFMLALDILILTIIGTYYKEFLAISFDTEFAMTVGLPVKLFQFLFLWLVGLAVVMMIRVVGLILVIALFSIPPNIAETFTSSLKTIIIYGSFFAIVFCTLGLVISYYFNLSSGATIVMIAAITYLVFLSLKDLAYKSRQIQQ